MNERVNLLEAWPERAQVLMEERLPESDILFLSFMTSSVGWFYSCRVVPKKKPPSVAGPLGSVARGATRTVDRG